MTEELEYKGKVHPKKFALWLLLLGILMLFAAFTSAYIVRKGDGNWFNFRPPTVFLYSTITVLISSVSMLYAYRSAKQDNIGGIKLGLIITIILGLVFSYLQYYGWVVLNNLDLHFVNNNNEISNNISGDRISASFLIVIAGVHLVHIFAGILFLFTVLFKTFQSKIHKTSSLLLDMCNTYWHFMGLLWVYLYLFLYFAPEF
jgi:cytochrome c oxidase subunit 3